MRSHVLPPSAALLSIPMPAPQPHGAQHALHGLVSSGVSNSTMPQPFERPAASRSHHSGLLEKNEQAALDSGAGLTALVPHHVGIPAGGQRVSGRVSGKRLEQTGGEGPGC